MASAHTSMRKYAFAGQVLILVVLFLGQELGSVKCDCNTNAIRSSLGSCFSQASSTPDYNSPCCSQLRYVHDKLQPSDDCICGILSNSAVVNAGLTKDEAKTFISNCVGANALPSCLKS